MAKSLGMPGWESAKLQIRMDANNIFNHPAFQSPDSQIDHSNFNDTSVGKITGVDGSGRVIQLSGRFSF